MTRKQPHRGHDPAQTMQDLAHAKQQHAQHTPAWPSAKEQAEPQHAGARPADAAVPGEAGQTPPSKAGYERSDINKRHH
jgi:hypothetical protein